MGYPPTDAAPATPTVAPARAKVVTNNDNSRQRTLFEGLVSDARKFIQNNYPRAHVEPPNQDPGVPDVKLVHSDGSAETYHAEQGWSKA